MGSVAKGWKKAAPLAQNAVTSLDKFQSGKAFRKWVSSFNADIVPNWYSP